MSEKHEDLFFCRAVSISLLGMLCISDVFIAMYYYKESSAIKLGNNISILSYPLLIILILVYLSSQLILNNRKRK